MKREYMNEKYISIYTTQLLPKTVACNLLTTWVVLCTSSTQLTYDNLGKVCACVFESKLTILCSKIVSCGEVAKKKQTSWKQDIVKIPQNQKQNFE
jgi:hypothetical protein